MTAPVRVRLYDPAGTTVTAEATVRRPYLMPLGIVEVLSESEDTVSLRLRPERGIARVDEDGEPLPDVPVGAIPILTRNTTTGEFTVVELVLPPPPAFPPGGVDEMWQAVCALPSPVPASIRHQGLWAAEAAGKWSEEDVFVASLPWLLAEARHLVHRWPQREALETYWRSVELPGGREDVMRTLRAPHVPVAVLAGRAVPTRSLRWRASTEPWTVEAVEVLAREVGRRVREIRTAEAGLDEMLAPLAGVEALARRRDRRTDPPPSSWPWPLRRFHDAALDVLLDVSAAGAGSERAPLCHLWRLYEGWVSHELFAFLGADLGAPAVEPTFSGFNSVGGATWWSRWRGDGTVVDLWSQPEIDDRGFVPCDDPGLAVISVSSSLIPDALVAVRRHGDLTLIVFDAKHTGERQMTPGEVTRAVSKYLWGIRAAADPSAPGALRRVVLVSSGSPGYVFDAGRARIHGLSAVPVAAPLQSHPELPALL